MCSGTREEGLTIVQSERWKLEGTELRQGDKGHALLFLGSSSNLWFEQNPVIMRNPCKRFCPLSQKSPKWAEEIWFNPQSPCKEVSRIAHTYNPTAWNVETSGSPGAHKPGGLRVCVCVIMGVHACVHINTEREKQTDRGRQ